MLWAMRWAAALFAIGLAGCEAAGNAVPPANAQAPLQPCAIASVPEPALCGSVRVRESASSTREIDLRVIVLPALSSPRLPDPIVPLSGGPGQGSAALAWLMAPRYAAFRTQRDIVFIDARGTGSSNGLQCESPRATTDLVGRIFDPAALAACRDELSRRADLTQYTTSMAAQDYERVFDQLGYDTVNLMGVSYGTRMGLEITRQIPGRVRTLTIEGVVPTTFDWPSRGAADAESALNAVIEDCESDRSCSARYPRFRQDVDVAFARVRRGPVNATVRDPATGAIETVPFGDHDLAYATRGVLYGNDALSLPSWFRQAAEGDFTALAQAYVTRARALDDQLALGLLFGVYCAEDLPFVDWTAAAKQSSGTRLGSYLLDQYRQGCDVWPRGAVDESFRQPIQSNVPTLLMSGRHDPVTPPRTATDAARTLPRSRVLIWPNGGHGTDGLATADCRTAIQDAFLRTADPDQLPLGCVTTAPVRAWR
jgi:pimeloyl-ACP methyl ester carboxylesterase